MSVKRYIAIKSHLRTQKVRRFRTFLGHFGKISSCFGSRRAGIAFEGFVSLGSTVSACLRLLKGSKAIYDG